jgi:hypothetical protein
MNGATNPQPAPQDDCGCCAGPTAETPADTANRPGLSSIAYRVGTHGRFKASMLAALSSSKYAALAGLRTRDDDDLAIALLDAWATVADVLTFYQERTANESYLRTAKERLSVQYLARLIGFELRPGVAASTVLAFALQDAPGAPDKTLIDVGVQVQSVPGPGETPQTFETVEAITARVEWNALRARTTVPQQIGAGDTELYLQGTGTQLQPGDAILLVGDERAADPASERWDFRLLQTVEANTDKNYTRVSWAKGLGGPRTAPAAANVKVYALRQRAALFGNNAPDPLLINAPASLHTDRKWNNFQLPPLDLDAAYPKIINGSWLVLVTASPFRQVQLYRANSVSYPSRSDFALSGKVTHIEPDTNENLSEFGLRETIVYAQNEPLLPTAEVPILDPSTGLPPPVMGATVMLGAPASDLAAGQFLMAFGKDSATGADVSELVQLASVDATGTRLTFTAPLLNSYALDSIALNANTARATHGETVKEVMGGGDASQAYQQFTLLQEPLTFVSAPTPTGAKTTLQVRVNDVLWAEVPTLYGAGPRDRIYVTRNNDDGSTAVEFGDGHTGARLPTGQANVKATYRKGVGTAGLVKAGQLTLLQTRPLGVNSVVNPADAAGAEDPQTIDDARRTAPLTVLTLDRTVSLKDYEDFVLPFGGVAKAQAVPVQVAGDRGVLLTVAGIGGAAVLAGGDLYKNLAAALGRAGDPFVPVRLASFREAPFRVAGTVTVDPAYLPGDVLAAVGDALKARFGFGARDFGQPVAYSEVVAATQAVDGVVAVTLTKLYRQDDAAAGLNMILAPAPASLAADGTPTGAEILTLDETSLTDLGPAK